MTIQKFDKATVRNLSAEIEAALAPIAAKHGITMKTGGGTFDAGSFSVKVQGACAAGEAQTRQRLEVYGLEMGKVSPDGFKLIGYDPSRRTRPFMGEKNGKTYIFDLPGASMRWASAARV